MISGITIAGSSYSGEWWVLAVGAAGAWLAKLDTRRWALIISATLALSVSIQSVLLAAAYHEYRAIAFAAWLAGLTAWIPASLFAQRQYPLDAPRKLGQLLAWFIVFGLPSVELCARTGYDPML